MSCDIQVLNRLKEIDPGAEHHTRNKDAIHCYVNDINPFQWPEALATQRGHPSTTALPVAETPQDTFKAFTLPQSPESIKPPLQLEVLCFAFVCFLASTFHALSELHIWKHW